MRATLPWLIVFSLLSLVRADGPKDNLPDQVRRIPAPGVEVTPADRQLLESDLAALGQAIDRLRKRNDSKLSALVPDVEIFRKAVHDALVYREFFTPQEIARGKALLKNGLERAAQLEAGQAPWTTQTGLVVRGYESRIDGSVQPYGLVVPDSYSSRSAKPYRLDIWFHGRGETLSEVNFIDQRQKQVGQFAPADTIVLHPYGRYCNAFKFAGETDVLEALESTKSRYHVDDDRTSVRGFSMGGAACWQFAVHYTDRWFAANPGAGFAETPQFLKVFQTETLTPTWYEQVLWRLYDCPGYATNLLHCPTVAYSGEIDGQKQAADVMQQALEKEDIDLEHIIGPQTKHKYHPEAAATVERLMESIAVKGRERVPRHVEFSTFTLRYNRLAWVSLTGLNEHWKQAKIIARIVDDRHVAATTENISDLELSIPAGWCPMDITQRIHVKLDDQTVVASRPKSDRSWQAAFYREGSQWRLGTRPADGLRKTPGLQGPIDDAFMESFIFVRPTGQCASPQVDAWAKAELDRAIEHWRRQFRGEARVKKDVEISDTDIAQSNLVLWGDPAANAVLRRIADKLPIRYANENIEVGQQTFAAEHHAPILIYPNPLNPAKYVVVNSSFTYRDYDYLNNARQVPKLPDWAVVDVRTPPDSRYPGKIVAADFFGEQWQVRPPHQD